MKFLFEKEDKSSVKFSIKLAEGDKGTLDELVTFSGEFQQSFWVDSPGPATSINNFTKSVREVSPVEYPYRYYLNEGSYSIDLDFNSKYELLKVVIDFTEGVYPDLRTASTTIEKFNATKPTSVTYSTDNGSTIVITSNDGRESGTFDLTVNENNDEDKGTLDEFVFSGYFKNSGETAGDNVVVTNISGVTISEAGPATSAEDIFVWKVSIASEAAEVSAKESGTLTFKDTPINSNAN